jgi:hypothetical protein
MGCDFGYSFEKDKDDGSYRWREIDGLVYRHNQKNMGFMTDERWTGKQLRKRIRIMQQRRRNEYKQCDQLDNAIQVLRSVLVIVNMDKRDFVYLNYC